MRSVVQERRGNWVNKNLDRWVGSLLLAFLDIALGLQRLFKTRSVTGNNRILVVCFGAIGDLILLSEAVRACVGQREVYLACSKLNHGAAKRYGDLYVDSAVVELRNPLSLHMIAQRFRVSAIFDSTQWANIGPIQVAVAGLLDANIKTTGFYTESVIRNGVYDMLVPHGRHVHEVLNFANLLYGKRAFEANAEIPRLIPWLYQERPIRRTRKVLLHMWPSGNRSYLKAWPESDWHELIKFCVGIGDTVYLSGAPADYVRTEQFMSARASSSIINIAGRYSLTELSAFIENEIELVVSVNTGILHLAASTGVPVIGLHGGVNPDRWGPLNDRSISLVPQSGTYGYLHYGFEYPKDDAEAYVLDKLTVAQVKDAIENLRASR